jgi:hypothetical protein
LAELLTSGYCTRTTERRIFWSKALDIGRTEMAGERVAIVRAARHNTLARPRIFKTSRRSLRTAGA